jgi:hypothetical protein
MPNVPFNFECEWTKRFLIYKTNVDIEAALRFRCFLAAMIPY